MVGRGSKRPSLRASCLRAGLAHRCKSVRASSDVCTLGVWLAAVLCLGLVLLLQVQALAVRQQGVPCSLAGARGRGPVPTDAPQPLACCVCCVTQCVCAAARLTGDRWAMPPPACHPRTVTRSGATGLNVAAYPSEASPADSVRAHTLPRCRPRRQQRQLRTRPDERRDERCGERRGRTRRGCARASSARSCALLQRLRSYELCESASGLWAAVGRGTAGRCPTAPHRQRRMQCMCSHRVHAPGRMRGLHACLCLGAAATSSPRAAVSLPV